MQKISRITTQKKNSHRFNVFLEQDGNEYYAFSVEEDTLIAEHLHKGMEIDQATIQSLIEKDDLHKGYSLALHYLSFRMRSSQEMYQYLMKKELDQEQIDVIIDRLINEKWLDDRMFAEAFVRTKVQTTSKGPQLIKKELLEKGVAASIAEASLVHYPFDKQLAKAKKLIIKKQAQSNKLSFKQQKNKMVQRLLQKGFTQDIIQEALEQTMPEQNNEEEWQALLLQGEKVVRKHEKKWSGNELEQKVKMSLYQKGFSFDQIEKFIHAHLRSEQ